ncbi:MAG: hypothetical protein MRY64_03855 [Hyphomonadaceae bacterium]|nr:hypothetical protein [Hyphomonadaceae bacterium]
MADIHAAFVQVFELTMRFLSNPCIVWKNGDAEQRKPAVRLVFSEPLRHARKEGFRTPNKSIVFKALEDFLGPNLIMAERQGKYLDQENALKNNKNNPTSQIYCTSNCTNSDVFLDLGAQAAKVWFFR